MFALISVLSRFPFHVLTLVVKVTRYPPRPRQRTTTSGRDAHDIEELPVEPEEEEEKEDEEEEARKNMETHKTNPPEGPRTHKKSTITSTTNRNKINKQEVTNKINKQEVGRPAVNVYLFVAGFVGKS